MLGFFIVYKKVTSKSLYRRVQGQFEQGGSRVVRVILSGYSNGLQEHSKGALVFYKGHDIVMLSVTSVIRMYRVGRHMIALVYHIGQHLC